MGIQNGLSIIGTSGVVRPMSEEAFKNSLSPQISVAKALGAETIVLVPGKIGLDDFSQETYLFWHTANFSLLKFVPTKIGRW